METISIKLNNGYNLVAAKDFDPNNPHSLSIYVEDEEGVFNQDLVTIDAYDNNFDLKVYADGDNEDWTNGFQIDLYRDPDVDSETIIEEAEEARYGDSDGFVKEIQRRLRDLGYFHGSIGGNYLTQTAAAVEAFQLNSGLHVDGSYCDKTTIGKLFSDEAQSKGKDVPDVKPEYRTAVEMDWWKSDIQKIFAKGVTATITDVETGLVWQEQRRGGTNHADVQPLTKEDTEKLKRAYGGKWRWNRRAIWVTIDGKNYAASMNGMPHGGSSIKDNGFDGHHCIHFTNSRTHCSNKVCPIHQKMIKKAAAAKLAK